MKFNPTVLAFAIVMAAVFVRGDGDTTVLSPTSPPPTTSTPTTPSPTPSPPPPPATTTPSVTTNTPVVAVSTDSKNATETTSKPLTSGSTSGTDPSAVGQKLSGTSSSMPIILGCVVGGLVVLALLVGFVYRRKRRSSSNSQNSSDDDDNLNDPKPGVYTNYTTGTTGTTNSTVGVGGSTNAGTAFWNDPDLLAVRVSPRAVKDVKRIGSGAFADVWLVTYRNTRHAASKRLRDATRVRTQAFIDEIKLVATLKHPNIVTFIGAAWTQEADLQALFEFADSGDLREYLQNPHVPRHWTPEKLQIAVDIVEALVYVHSFAPPLVHRDLKSRNVLLNSSGEATLRAKLTDFGVSRYQTEDNTMTTGVGTCRWLAPEVIIGDGTYGSAADIFSFGAVLSELDTHALPYDDVRSANGNPLAQVAMLQRVASGELTPSFLPSCPRNIFELAQQCLLLRPEDRPSAPQVAFALRTYIKST